MICLACKKPLSPPKKKYCNMACTMVAWRRAHPRPDRFCPVCKNTLPKERRGGRKYCGQKCKMRAFFSSAAGKEFVARKNARLNPSIQKAWRTKHNLTEAQLEAMAERQNHKCAICKNETKLCVDHDHTSGKVRGLLCSRCNSGLGFFRDSIDFLKSAVEYLDSLGTRP